MVIAAFPGYTDNATEFLHLQGCLPHPNAGIFWQHQSVNSSIMILKRASVILMFFIPHVLFAQSEPPNGVQFENIPSWSSVKEKAKKEHKYILIDGFASWCKPCQAMDRNVYPLDSVGSFVNKHYLPVKVQFDSTSGDNNQTKAWYADAHYLEKEYTIKDYPTFLFFSPEGKLIHRSIGYKDPGRFLAIVRRTLDPQYQYYTQLETFRQGKMPFDKMAYLAELARSIGEDKVAVEVSQHYIDSYLLKQDAKALYTKKKLQFIADFLQGSGDKAFRLFYTEGSRIDTVLKSPNFSRNLVDRTIEREEINPRIYADEKALKEHKVNPDWSEFHQRIKEKYDPECADRVVLWAKIQWLDYKHDWPEYCKNMVLKVEKYGPYNKYNPYESNSKEELLNYSAWEIFRRSTDTGQLEKALEWSEMAIKANPTPATQYLDTYANILYKLGRISEATRMEEKAISLEPADVLTKEYSDNLKKIKKGEPTWPTK
jgi:thioredoxin-related protein